VSILLTAFYPVGGIRTYIRYIYGSTSFEGEKLTLLAPDEGLKIFLDEHLPKQRIELIKVNGKFDFVITLIKLIVSGEYRIVHSHGFSAGFFTYLATKFSSCIHIMTAHDVFTKRQFLGFKGKLKLKLINYIFSRINYIHTVTADANQN